MFDMGNTPANSVKDTNSDECTKAKKMKLHRIDYHKASHDASKDNSTSSLSHTNCKRKHNFNNGWVRPSSTVKNITQSNLDNYHKVMAPLKRSSNEDIIRHAKRSKNDDRPHPRCRKSLFAQAEDARINFRASETKHQISSTHLVSPLNKEIKQVKDEVDETQRLSMKRAKMTLTRPLIFLPPHTISSSSRHYSSSICSPCDSSNEISDDCYFSQEGNDNGDCKGPSNVVDVRADVAAGAEEDSEAEYDQPRLLPENYVAPRRQRRLPFRRSAKGLLCLRARRRLVFGDGTARHKLSLKHKSLLNGSPAFLVSECDKRQVRRRLFQNDKCFINDKDIDVLTQQLSHCSTSRSNQFYVSDPARINNFSRQCSSVIGSVSEFSHKRFFQR